MFAPYCPNVRFMRGFEDPNDMLKFKRKNNLSSRCYMWIRQQTWEHLRATLSTDVRDVGQILREEE